MHYCTQNWSYDTCPTTTHTGGARRSHGEGAVNGRRGGRNNIRASKQIFINDEQVCIS
jgi:hypothetical protein